MRFYLDENIPVVTARYLQNHRHNTRHAVLDYGYQGRGDAFHYAVARQERRILVSIDRHFENHAEFPLAGSPGIIVLDMGFPPTVAQVHEALRRLLRHFRTNASLRECRVTASTAGYIQVTHEGVMYHDYK
ncbi:MAG: DUF5615 family PIN-like protein [Chloroflexi bacterium]|nr:DUF5615 family PIN-like protein [Chloroflexota bacterium]MBU1750544.1 DUF5615 family PIN-like protein [Chloroflexota bacterium]MBU1878076.1 DUF5615 family PIN-like protein [Chloroflexota bacterium]